MLAKILELKLHLPSEAVLMQHQEGFSLIEALIATAIVAVGFGMLAQLTFAVLRGSDRARFETFAAVAASEKLEQLRSAAWSGDQAALTPSPDDTLDENADGYFDILDRSGRIVADSAPGVYVRRWSIKGAADPDLFIIQVAIARRGLPARAQLAGTVRFHAPF